MFSLLLVVSVISLRRPLGTGGHEDGEATKGCKLIRFLSLHAPLPVLLLCNPGGQRCSSQRLDGPPQWGNNWYKLQLAAETLSVVPNDIPPPAASAPPSE